MLSLLLGCKSDDIYIESVNFIKELKNKKILITTQVEQNKDKQNIQTNRNPFMFDTNNMPEISNIQYTIKLTENSFYLVGVFKVNNEKWAIIKDKNNLMYVLTIGMHIKNTNIIVKDIKKEAIVLQTVTDNNTESITLRINKGKN